MTPTEVLAPPLPVTKPLQAPAGWCPHRMGAEVLKPSAVLIHLRRDGVIAHLAVFSPLVGSRIVVFLEANAGQQELAAASVRRMPGVAGVSFPSDTNAIMYVKLGVS